MVCNIKCRRTKRGIGAIKWFFQDSTNLNNISKYIVDANGDTPYTTIQSALDAANTAGVAAVVEVRPGTYTEDLTLYTGITIDGGSLGTTISGNHTPPLVGTFTFRNVLLLSLAGDIIASAAAGTAILLITNCIITVVNGYIYDLPNWTGPLAMTSCTDASANNGIINNDTASTVYNYNIKYWSWCWKYIDKDKWNIRYINSNRLSQ